MTEISAQPVKIDGYHAHVYYDAETRPRAERLRETITNALGVEVRELSDEPRGPHPVPQFRFMFTNAQFENVVPWLGQNFSASRVCILPEGRLYKIIGDAGLLVCPMVRGRRELRYPGPRPCRSKP